ncbi:MAG: hypothetical protein IK135_04735 [Bacteroidales bacterium]|nr:hypothetical protein [Bacteroidales bacterium]
MISICKKYRDLASGDKISFVLFFIVSILLIGAYMLAAFRSPVNADAGYYLGTVELIHDGLVPYRDFKLDYTPLFFYILQIPRWFMGTYPNYTVYMLFLYVVVLLDAVLLAAIVKKISKSIKWAWFSAIAFLILYYYLDGAYFVLEACSVCFGLASMLMLMGEKQSVWRIMLSGAFAALAFWAKQYGVMFVGVVGVLLLFSEVEWKKRMLNCLYATIGFCVVMALFVALFMISGLGIEELVNALSGSGYGKQASVTYFEGIEKAAKLFPYLLFVPYLFFGKKDKELGLIIACLASILLASLQFYFNVFPHYYVYLLPFVLVLNVLMWKQLNRMKVSRTMLLLYFGLMFASIAIPLQSVYKNSKALAKNNLRAGQVQTAKELRQIVDSYSLESAMCYWGTLPYYALCPLHPSAIENYSFSFGYDTEETYCERLVDADCFVIDKKQMKDVEEMERLNRMLHEGFPIVENVPRSDVVVFIRNK